MHSRHRSLRLLLASVVMLTAAPVVAADVTPERLANPEPGNWLMNHRTYDAQRYSPLDKINKTTLAYAVAIGGTSVNENLEATPLADDGFLYVVDQWGVVYKIDGRSGDVGRILWRMDPGQEKLPSANRGAALWGNLVISVANFPARVIATNKETGKVAWEANLSDGQPDLALTAAPLAIKDKIVIGGAMWVTGSYDVATNQVLWGTGNPVPMYNPYYRPGDNLYTNSLISWDPDTGRMNWYHQYVPGDMWDYDAAGAHILIDGLVSGQPHKLVTHSARNGFLYALERSNGQTLLAKPYMDEINWTKGIDQKTGLPIDYDPAKDIQVYSGLQNQTLTDRTKKLCPSHEGGNNYWSASFSQRTRLLYIPSRPTCNEMTMTPDQLRNPTSGSMLGGGIRLLARTESEIVVADPFTGEVKNRVRAAYPNVSAALTTAGGLLFTGLGDGTFIAYDDTSLEPLWKINVGSGFNAPPMTFEAGGRQYVAIMSGLSRISMGRLVLTPELREMRNQTMLFVFGL
jgi:alcohol dehydrogenase (cytochrome c)